MPMSIRTKIASLAEQITAKLERQYREDAY
jgi:hypothetical protein